MFPQVFHRRVFSKKSNSLSTYMLLLVMRYFLMSMYLCYFFWIRLLWQPSDTDAIGKTGRLIFALIVGSHNCIVVTFLCVSCPSWLSTECSAIRSPILGISSPLILIIIFCEHGVLARFIAVCYRGINLGICDLWGCGAFWEMTDANATLDAFAMLIAPPTSSASWGFRWLRLRRTPKSRHLSKSRN